MCMEKTNMSPRPQHFPGEDLKVEVVAGCVHPLHKGFPSNKQLHWDSYQKSKPFRFFFFCVVPNFGKIFRSYSVARGADRVASWNPTLSYQLLYELAFSPTSNMCN